MLAAIPGRSHECSLALSLRIIHGYLKAKGDNDYSHHTGSRQAHMSSTEGARHNHGHPRSLIHEATWQTIGEDGAS